jgi:UDP-N-acetylglucosamine--N-acetylmuramyl-(pentapeptide) pyrophosphoryl-undecaprenol N-acetylglucosamine transferase
MNDNKTIRIIVTGGGTAGHVMPIVSIADEIIKMQPNSSIRFIGQRSDKRSKDIVNKCKSIEKSYLISAGKLRRFHGRGLFWYFMHPTIIIRNTIDVFKLFLGIVESVIILIKFKPDVVFVKGGFVGLPVGLAAAISKIKIVTHDSDAIPGLTNRLLAKFVEVSAVALPVKYYKKYYNPTQTIQTGIPINNKFFSTTPESDLKQKMKHSVSSQVLCVIGGSLGAVRMNDEIIKLAPSLLVSFPKLDIIWSTGENQYKEIKMTIEKLGLGSRVTTEPFFNNLDQIFAISDLVISRAGATTIAELAASKKACIFIPNPVLTGGHQTKNAEILAINNAAEIVSENEIENSGDKLLNVITYLLQNKKKRHQLANNLSAFADSESTTKLARVILGVI